MRLKMFVLSIVFCGIVRSEEPQTIVLQKPPKSIAEALERFDDDTKAANKAMTKAESDWAARIERLEAVVIDQLKRLAKQHASGGDIAKASDAWTEVLHLDANDNDAK